VLDAGAGGCRHEGSYRVSAGLANDLSMLYDSFSHVLTAYCWLVPPVSSSTFARQG
jgi:hypothetical protein